MERRTLLKTLTMGIGALFSAIMGIPAIAYIIDPRHRKAPPGEFKRVARLADLPLPENGVPVPVQAVISNIRRDAWTLHPEEVVGRVWLVRKNDKDVAAFTSVCPHLSCSIDFDPAASVEGEAPGLFVCPCHRGAFYLSGERIPEDLLGRENPPPRGMDQLVCRVLVNGDIEVRYETASRPDVQAEPSPA
jgi:menaquinol-cytochrome c reductase iron-sulfur subunit